MSSLLQPSKTKFWSFYLWLFHKNGITIGTKYYVRSLNPPSKKDTEAFEEYQRRIRHESTHVAQFIEIFGEDTFWNRVKWVLLHLKYNVREWATAKMNPLEKEAYDNSWNVSYLDNRPFKAWKQYE